MVDLPQLAYSPCTQSLSCIRLFATPWTVAHPAPLSMEFSRQEYWNMLPSPTPADLPNSGMEPLSLAYNTLYVFNS